MLSNYYRSTETNGSLNQPEGFVETYLEYTQRQESPRQFHFWTAVSALSSAVGRKVFLDRGFYQLYPNHYIIMVAGSALSRKSSAINIGAKILRRALGEYREEGLGSGLTSILSAKMTPEALCRAISHTGIDSEDMVFDGTDLNRSRPVLLFSSELGVFMSKAAQINGLVDLLIDFYDCPEIWEYITKTSGTDIVHNVCANMLSATTPDWIAQNVTGSVFNQGFVGRTIFVHAEGSTHRNAHPYLTDYERYLETQCIEMLKSKFLLEGEMKLTKKASLLFENWYNQREESSMSAMESGFFGREHDHVLKLAMILSLSNSNTLIITDTHIQDSISLIGNIRENLVAVFEDVRRSGDVLEVQIVEDTIRKHSQLTQSQLLKLLYRKLDKDKLQKAVLTLKEAGKIDILIDKTNKKPKAIYKWADF